MNKRFLWFLGKKVGSGKGHEKGTSAVYL